MGDARDVFVAAEEEMDPEQRTNCTGCTQVSGTTHQRWTITLSQAFFLEKKDSTNAVSPIPH